MVHGLMSRNQAARRLAAAANAGLRAFPGLSVSVGMACFDSPAPPAVRMLQAAGALKYRAKQSGGGSLVVENFAQAGPAAR